MFSFKIRKAVLRVSLSLAAYYAMMEYFYQNLIIPNFPRFGFHFDMNIEKYIETKLLFLIVLLMSIVTSRKSQFIYAIIIFFIIFFLVPSLVTYSFSNQIPQPSYAIVVLLMSLGIISSITTRIPLVTGNRLSFGVVMFLILVSLIPIIVKFGFYLNIDNLLFKDVYDTREQFDEQSNTALNYLFNWLVKAIVPIALVYFLIHRRFWFAVLTFVALNYLYSISGNKIIYITSFVMLFFFFVGKDFIDKMRIASAMLVIGLGMVYLSDYFLGTSLIGLFAMRMLFLPAYLNYFYFDFFEGSPLFFAESHFFSLFNAYPFDRPIGFIIAQVYIHVNDMNANNGIIGDGYMNLGYWGVGLNIIIITVIFFFFNSMKPDARYLGIFCVLIFLFLSAPMLSMFITGGLWFLFFAGVTIMPEQKAIA